MAIDLNDQLIRLIIMCCKSFKVLQFTSSDILFQLKNKTDHTLTPGLDSISERDSKLFHRS